jgi:hypothetical protein
MPIGRGAKRTAAARHVSLQMRSRSGQGMAFEPSAAEVEAGAQAAQLEGVLSGWCRVVDANVLSLNNGCLVVL